MAETAAVEGHANWAGNYVYRAARRHSPATIAEAQELVRAARHLRVLGSRHSFNAIADSDADLLSLARIAPQLEIDPARHTATIDGGMTYGRLCPLLHAAGYALHNLASLPHISVAGACATATHGSGDANRNLAAAVSALEIIDAGGELVAYSRERNPDIFDGLVVGLGAAGVVARLTLDLQPAFFMQQEVYERLPFTELEDHFDAIESSAYSVSLFTGWQHDWIDQVWLKRRLAGDTAIETAPVFFGARLAGADRHPIDGISAAPCTPQMGQAGPWHERLPHFRIDETPSSGEELQSEYFVPREQARAALRAIAGLRERLAPLLLISEIRTVAADQCWMSPCYRRDSIGIHFTWKRDWPGVRQLLPAIEARLAPFAPRPHWGKLFTMPAAQVQAAYPMLGAFRNLLHTLDPHGKFRNAFIDEYIYGA